MNPVALYFASGESFYAGSSIVMLAVVISAFLERPWTLRLRNIFVWLALALIVMACPPFAWTVEAALLSVFAMWFVLCQRTAGSTTSRLRTAAGVVLFAFLLGLSISEFSHRKMPVINGAISDHLVVIGDSISSGIGPLGPPWPVVMQQLTGVPTKNLARPGARALDGKTMAAEIKGDRVVLVEIGGNDLLSAEPSEEFARGLDATLSELCIPGRTVVMFELPLLPHEIAYGRIQRRLAAKYGVWLIPKRYFASVVSGSDATSDGLHLSNLGAHRMAELVARGLSHVLKPPGRVPTT